MKNLTAAVTELLNMAKIGVTRPSASTPLGKALGAMTRPNNQTYHPGFKEELIALGAKDWF